MNIAPHLLVSDIAAKYPATIPTFERLGIDYCCGGKIPLASACRGRDVDTDAIVAELESVSTTHSDEIEPSWEAAPLGDLIEHIVHGYHEPLRRDLAILEKLVDKVLRRHSDRHPEMLPALGLTFQLLRDELLAHTRDEEVVCFPHVYQLLSGIRSPTLDVRTMLPQLTREHLKAGLLLKDLRTLTRDYTPPEGACPTFRALFSALEALERDLHRHVHLENGVLFPRAAALETELAQAARS